MSVRIEPHSFFGLRLPARSVSQLQQYLVESHSGSVVDWEDRLRSIAEDPAFKEALFLASPDLLRYWQRQASDKLPVDLQISLWRYVFRWHSRSTPYGLFAGVGIGSVGDTISSSWTTEAWQSCSKLDSSIITLLCQVIISDVSLRPYLFYRLNNSLFQIGNVFHFSEKLTDDESKPGRIVLSSIDLDPSLIEVVRQVSRVNEVSFTELQTRISEQLGLQADDSAALVDELITSNLLTSNFELPVTGDGSLSAFITQFNRLPSQVTQPALSALLESVSTQLAQSPTLGSYEQLQNTLQTIFSLLDPTVSLPGSLVQTDLFFYPDQLTLPASVLQQIGQQYYAILPVIRSTSSSLMDTFIKRFEERYGEQEIDLLTVLDSEVGIGFSNEDTNQNTLLSDLFPPDSQPSYPVNAPLDRLKKILYQRSLLYNLNEVSITDEDLSELGTEVSSQSVPVSWFVHGELFYNPSYQETGHTSSPRNDSNWAFSLNPGIPSTASSILGRFCYGHSELKNKVEDLCRWEQEQHPEDLIAEIVHLPNNSARLGNVIARPVLRTYEIPYLTPSAVSGAQTLLLPNLSVRLTSDRKIILIDKATGRRVRPRLSSAHNPLSGDEVYQFLTQVQQSEFIIQFWSWGSLDRQPYLPRVRYKNLILTPASWVIDKAVFETSAVVDIDYLRNLFRLPRYVLLIEGDNKLLLDLEVTPAQSILVDEVKKRRVVLYEWHAGEKKTWLVNGNECYESELVIPYQLLKDITPRPAPLSNHIVQRDFFPGDKWLYLKIYCPDIVGDYLLRDILWPLVQQLRKNGQIDLWFFIRYHDPEHHLRFRLHTGSAWTSNTLPTVLKHLDEAIKLGHVERIQVDTYQREMERYTPELIDQCEAVFSEDSEVVMSFLEQFTPGVPTDLDRYSFAVGSIFALLDDFNYSWEQKALFTETMQQRFWQEQGSSKEVKKKLNGYYRKYSSEFFSQASAYQMLYSMRSQSTKIQVDTIKQYGLDAKITRSVNGLIQSLIHMHITRLFASDNRRHELVIYHFLARYAATQKARLSSSSI